MGFMLKMFDKPLADLEEIKKALKKAETIIENSQAEEERLKEIKAFYEGKIQELEDERRKLKVEIMRYDFDSYRLMADIRAKDKEIKKLKENEGGFWK